MTDKPPADQPKPSQPPVVYVERKPEPEKRSVSVRARETANVGYRVIRWILLIILVVIAALFIGRNFERVEVDWVFRSSTVPLALVMLGFLLIGLVIGWLIHWFSSRTQRRP